MLVTAITLGILAFAVRALTDLFRQDGAKIVHALRGRSWAAAPRPERPVVVRFSSKRMVETPAWQTELSAAA